MLSNGIGDVVDAVARMLGGGGALWFADGPAPKLPDGVGAVVQTSGSTGGPRRVMLSRDALVAASLSAQTRLGGPMTWHLTLAPHYVAGLMVLVRSMVGGRAPVLASSDLADLRATGDGDALSLVPTQLHRALSSPDVTRELARFDAVLVGGQSLNPDLRRRAGDAGIRVVETYGMSETCGGCVWDGQPLPGVEVRLLDDDRAPEGSGRIALAGPMLFDGYLGDDDATSAALPDGALLTSDFGRMPDGRLVIGGRLDDVVITGGVNVDLAAVRRAVAGTSPDAAVIAVSDEEWGSRIVLFATSGTLASWRETLSEQLPRTALPRQFVLVDRVPLTVGGKPDRARLHGLAVAEQA